MSLPCPKCNKEIQSKYEYFITEGDIIICPHCSMLLTVIHECYSANDEYSDCVEYLELKNEYN